jgi:SAM-dependent methyltransferase
MESMKLETINIRKAAAMKFTLRWKSKVAEHTDCYFVNKVNLWRDLFPQIIADEIGRKGEGGIIRIPDLLHDIRPPENYDNLFNIRYNELDRQYFSKDVNQPHFGRFYPKGLLRNIPGVFKGNMEPFRCVGIDESGIKVDFNHPLSMHTAELTISLSNIRETAVELGGSCNDWMETVMNGPGMQARWRGIPTDFFAEDSFKRDEETGDALFYLKPRLVNHVDDKAISVLKSLYNGLLVNGMDVLDLMSSWKSHVPDTVTLKSLTGLGLNREELDRNGQLNDYVIHDINQDPHVPFKNDHFDAVLCNLSVEYLIDPFSVFEDVARILKPGGIFITTFSNRWFPPKAIKVWQKLHDFERMGLVTEYFKKSDMFIDLETYSVRGLPRPVYDEQYTLFSLSDPIYAVWGKKA